MAIQKSFPISDATNVGIAIKELAKITGTTVPGHNFTGKKLLSLFTSPTVLDEYSTRIVFAIQNELDQAKGEDKNEYLNLHSKFSRFPIVIINENKQSATNN